MQLTNAESFSLALLIAIPVCVVTVVVMNKLLTEPVLSFEEQDAADRKAAADRLTPNTFAENLAKEQHPVTQNAHADAIDRSIHETLVRGGKLLVTCVMLWVLYNINPYLCLPFTVYLVIQHIKNA